MTNEKVFKYEGTSAKPLATYFTGNDRESYIYFIDGATSDYSFTFDVYEDKRRLAYSRSNKQGYKIGLDHDGKNMMIGALDGFVRINILEVYEIN